MQDTSGGRHRGTGPTAGPSRPVGSRRPHAPLALLAAVLVAVLALGACNPGDSPVARSRAVSGSSACTVGVVGDSLIEGARDFGGLAGKLGATCRVTAIDAKVGRSTASGASVVEAWARAGQLPRILVVGLGTNDCSARGFRDGVARVFAAAGHTRPIVWINTWRPGCDAGINNVLSSVQTLANKQAHMGNLWLVDHHAWIEANRGLLAGDGIHMTATGYRLHADRIARAVANGSR